MEGERTGGVATFTEGLQRPAPLVSLDGAEPVAQDAPSRVEGRQLLDAGRLHLGQVRAAAGRLQAQSRGYAGVSVKQVVGSAPR